MAAWMALWSASRAETTIAPPRASIPITASGTTCRSTLRSWVSPSAVRPFDRIDVHGRPLGRIAGSELLECFGEHCVVRQGAKRDDLLGRQVGRDLHVRQQLLQHASPATSD